MLRSLLLPACLVGAATYRCSWTWGLTEVKSSRAGPCGWASLEITSDCWGESVPLAPVIPVPAEVFFCISLFLILGAALSSCPAAAQGLAVLCSRPWRMTGLSGFPPASRHLALRLRPVRAALQEFPFPPPSRAEPRPAAVPCCFLPPVGQAAVNLVFFE